MEQHAAEDVVGVFFLVCDTARRELLVLSPLIYNRQFFLPGSRHRDKPLLQAVQESFRKQTGVRMPQHLISLEPQDIYVGEHWINDAKCVQSQTYFIPVNSSSRKNFKNAGSQPNEGTLQWVPIQKVLKGKGYFIDYIRDCLTHFRLITNDALRVVPESKTRSLISILYREPKPIEEHARHMALIQRELAVHMRREKSSIQTHKDAFGADQDYTSNIDGVRYWVWERGLWRVYVSNKKGCTFEAHEEATPEQALKAYEEYLDILDPPFG